MAFTSEQLQDMPGYREARELAVATGVAATAGEAEIRDLVLIRNEDHGGRRSYTMTVEVLAAGEGRIREAAREAASGR